MTVRIAYLATHPIQYQAPLLRLIAAEPGIELKTFFRSPMGLKSYVDKGFGRDQAKKRCLILNRMRCEIGDSDAHRPATSSSMPERRRRKLSREK